MHRVGVVLAAAFVATLVAGPAAAAVHSGGKGKGQAALRAEAKVSEEAARKTALAEVPGGTVKSSELEREHGKLIYSFDIVVPGKPGVEEVNVDARDGTVVAHQHETPADEAKEAHAAHRRPAKHRTPGTVPPPHTP